MLENINFQEEYSIWKKWFVLSIILTTECMVGVLFCTGVVKGICLAMGILGALLIILSLLATINAKQGIQLEKDLEELEYLKKMSEKEKRLLDKLGYTKDLYERQQIQDELDKIIEEHNSRLLVLAKRKKIDVDLD